jgi:UDP-glucose 4-epimerase
MRYLVTGGAGFIGSALANRLVKDGHEVVVLDDLSNGVRQNLAPNVLFQRGDVNDGPRLWSLLQDVDCVYHLAARVSVAESLLYSADYNHTNVGGTVSLMEAMRVANVRRVVFASSGSVYGNQHEQPVHEDDVPEPDSPYAVSKYAAEQYVRCIGRIHHIETVSLRIFNAYGERQPLPVSHAPVVPRFMQQALTGGSVVIHGNGAQTRDFVYISDVVAALIAASTAPNVDQQVINIGSGEETSIAELASAIGLVTNRTVHTIYPDTHNTGGVARLVAEISRARTLLGYRPQVDLADGLARMLHSDDRFAQRRTIAYA